MDQTLSYFVYSPPKSNSHGHGVRNNNIRRATQKVIDSFVNSFNATTDGKLQITLHYDILNEVDKTLRTISELGKFLGPTKQASGSVNRESTDHTITWENDNINILEFLDYVNKLDDGSYLPISKYWISCFYNYGDNSKPNGFIMCSIEAGRLFVRLKLILPYSINDKKSYDLLSHFQKTLPFKLNGKHFRRLGPSKQGYGQWKLDEETQNRLNDCLAKSTMK